MPRRKKSLLGLVLPQHSWNSPPHGACGVFLCLWACRRLCVCVHVVWPDTEGSCRGPTHKRDKGFIIFPPKITPRPDGILMNNYTQIDVDMARSPANGERPRKLRAVGNFVAEEPTPPVRRAPLPDSEQPDAVKRRKLVQERPRPRPSDHCPSYEVSMASTYLSPLSSW